MVESDDVNHGRNTSTMIRDIDLDHVALAFEDRRPGQERYAGELGGEWVGGGADPGFWSEQVRFANGMKVELLEPLNVEENDFLRRFLDRNGPGPHHLTFKVKDIRAALELVEQAGYRPVSVNLENEHWKEAFLHPKDAPGVVVQLAQSSESGDWGVPLPDGYPTAAGPTTTLARVVHAVATLDVGTRLFADLLAGETIDKGEDADGRWVDLGWPGPGRIRLVEPASPSSPIATWIGDRAGRVHHLHFTGSGQASRTIEPEDNNGVRLVIDG
jgi:catechol 2,3-dioxygenase-like lactoylglutathione lyase family enzyme